MNDDEPKVFCVNLGPLGEWWCVPADGDEEWCLRAIHKKAVGGPLGLHIDLVRDRLYGGFGCNEPGRRHVYYATGQYTYLGENFRLTDEERAEQWKRLIETNGEPGAGPFTHAGPVVRA